MKILHLHAGFTLIELMIAITVAAVLLVVGIPSFQYAVLNGRVKTAASDFHISLLLARSEAIKRGVNITVGDNGNGWDIKDGTEIVRSYNDLNADVDLLCDIDGDDSADTCPASITINRNGRLTNPPFALWFYTTKKDSIPMRCVSISLSGMPRVVVDTDNVSSNGCG